MTYFDAETARRQYRRVALAAVIGVASLSLAGCETSSSLFASNTPPPPPVAAAPPAPVAPQPIARIGLAPVIGAPDALAKQIASQLTQSGDRQRIAMVPGADFKGDFTLRGYIVASRDKRTVKVSYIWDLTDPNGKRVNRITGEEVTPAGAAKDPWASVNAALTQTIADKTVTNLASWLPQHAPRPVAPVAAAPAAPPRATPIAAAPPAATQPVAMRQPAPTSTASLPTQLAAVVPTVTGAPGDGSSALAASLQRELIRQGVAIANRPGSSYRIEGRVAMGSPNGGKQTIQIDWHVRDPHGKSLGTVSQKNEIPAGSLDGAWGQTADAAAGAAAQGILKLLPQPRSIN